MENDPDIVAMVAASAALTLSGAPFMGPIGAARVGFIDDEYVLNPTIDEMKESKLDLVVAGTQDAVLMVESEAKELSEEIMLGAVMFGHRHFQPVIDAIIQPRREGGEGAARIRDAGYGGDREGDARHRRGRPARGLCDPAQGRAPGRRRRRQEEGDGALLPGRHRQSRAADAAGRRRVQGPRSQDRPLEHPRHLEAHRRPRSRHRAPDRLRGGVLPRTHGSALFTRGETQALVVATLGTGEDEQFIDALEGTYKEAFLLHYNFPPFSVGETGRMGAPGRREIGHGKLAWRAIRPMLPSKEEFPYTIRVVSEITESNGSSSMATVCGTSLALMDAGVPLKRPTAGIAMGLIKEGERFAVLSDILGDEDHLGDMDFKVAGTEVGVTSLQMDIKIAGITEEIMKVALDQAKGGRMHILGEMAKALDTARAELGEHAPRIEIDQDPDRQDPRSDRHRRQGDPRDRREDRRQDQHRGRRHGEGRVRRTANRSRRRSTGSSRSPPSRRSATIYEGKVVKVMDFGAFVNFFGAKDGLVHICQLAAAPGAEGHRRGQGRRQREGQAPGLRRSRQDPAVDEGRRPGDRRGPRSQAEGRRRAAAQEAVGGE